jgi:hypothetical protein
MPSFWKYEKCPPLHVKGLDERWSVEVWKVTSGDTGIQYYVQILTGAHGTTPVHSTYICNCKDAMIHGQNLVAIVKEGTGCKHTQKLAEYFDERRPK